MKAFTYFIFCLTVLTSCSKKEENIAVTEFTVDLTKNRLKSLNEILTFEKFIYLEVHPDALINHIDRIFLTKDDKIIVFDENSKKIILFSNDGKYIRNIGKAGKGPHEFNSPNDIAFDPKTESIYVLTRAKKIKVYNLQGSFVKDINIGIWGNCIYTYDNHLFIYNISQSEKIDKAFLISDINGKNEKQFIPLPNKREDFNYMPRNNFCETKNGLCFFSPFNYNIYLYHDNDVIHNYKFDFLKNSAPDNYISKINSREEFYNFITNSNLVHSITTYLELDNLIYLEIVIQKNTYSVFIDKYSGEEQTYFHRNLHDLFVQIAPITVQNDKFVNVFYPHYKLSPGINYNFRMKYTKDKIDEGLANEFLHLTHMDLDQNPVIILTTANRNK